jgi:nucleotide-binding universal stress UspA family protein
MSVDNVIAIAGAAEGAGGNHTMPLVIFGLLVSIPIIVWGSQLVLKLMDRFPIVITVGGMLLGWIAGTMAVTDPGILPWMPQDGGPKPEVLDSVRYGAGVAGALLVLALGKWLASRRRVETPAAEAAAATAAGVAARHIRRVLLAVDGSPTAAAAVQRVLALREDLREGQALELHLVNVQRPLSEDVSRFIAGKTIEEHHRENSEQAFVAARGQLGPVAASAREHALVGAPGPTIAGLARELGADLIVLGARGLGASTAALLGSVAQATIEQANVPVLVVK